MKNMQNLRVYIFTLLFVTCMPAHAAEPQISAGRYHNLAANDSGSVYWWGQEYGLTYYLGKPAHAQPPTLVPGLPKISAVAAGTWHSVALGEDGAIFEWGFSPYHMYEIWMTRNTLGACETARLMWAGQGNDPCADEVRATYAKMYVEIPIPILGIPSARAIAATDSVTVALGRDGNVYCWGPAAAPQRIPGLEDITAIRLGGFHGVALRSDGAVLTWGSDVNGELGSSRSSPRGNESICRNPMPQVVFTASVAVGASVSNSYALRADGSVWGWGSNVGDMLGGVKGQDERKVDAPRKIATTSKIIQIVGGSLHAVARDADGKVYAWGSNISNSIWPGDTIRHSMTPVPLTALNEIREISAYDHNIALTHDGYVCAWGENRYGTARPGSTLPNVLAPVPVMLADGKTPLKLMGKWNETGEQPSTICGIMDWRDRVAMWEDAIEKQKLHLKLLGEKAERKWEHEQKLFREVTTKECVCVQKGDTALETALRNKDYDAMRKLLANRDIDVNAQNSLGWTTLMDAVARGDVESINMLLAAGADADIGNGLDIDPLSLARRDDKTEIIAILKKALHVK